jgi:hypothetical protein
MDFKDIGELSRDKNGKMYKLKEKYARLVERRTRCQVRFRLTLKDMINSSQCSLKIYCFLIFIYLILLKHP